MINKVLVRKALNLSGPKSVFKVNWSVTVAVLSNVKEDLASLSVQ